MAVAPEASPRRTDALTGLRFFAAGWVFLFHAWKANGTPAPIQAIVRAGAAGVPLFFILSGFVLALNYVRPGRPFNAKSFAVARLARIYPVYVLALLSALPLMFLSGVVYHAPRAMFYRGFDAFVLLQNWWPGPRYEILAPSWTLSVEAFFYCIAIFLFARARLTSYGRNLAAAAAWFALTVVMTVGAWQAGYNVDWEWAPLQLPAFLIGIELGKAYLVRGASVASKPAVGDGVVIAAALVGLAIVLRSPFMPQSVTHAFLLAPFAVLIMALATFPSVAQAWLSRPTLLLLGGASYAIYLFHFQLNVYGHQVGERLGVRTDGLPYAFVLSLVVIAFSIAVFRYFEEPMRHRIRTMFAGKGARVDIRA